MKRTFPWITILISISLVGLIFFQFLWLKSAKEFREKRVSENISTALSVAANILTSHHDSALAVNPAELGSKGERLILNINNNSVHARYSEEQVADVIRLAFEANDLKNVPFEFAVSDLQDANGEIRSAGFMEAYTDSSNNLAHTIPLVPESGSAYENLTPTEFLVIIVPHEDSPVLDQMAWIIFGAVMFTLIIMAAFFLTLRTLFNQKKLAEIKSDFINNMTHEFKTPLATISLAVDALKNEKVTADKDKSAYFTAIIKEENRRMNKQVEAILQAALLDKREVQLNLKKLNAHELIKAALNNIKLPVEERGGTIEPELEAQKDCIMADEVHFTNFVNNLLDNALKYSKEVPHIKLCTLNQGHRFLIRVEDTGIGMNKDTLSHIFEKFYRAHTGNVHNVKGFGLGLSYVKTMVEAHKGTIKAESTPGKGSKFTLSFPLSKA